MPAQRMMKDTDIEDGRRKYQKSLKLEVHLADHCNLNCKGCDHFSPISEMSFLDVEQYEKDIKRIGMIAGDYLEHLFLLGGEPLLNREIVRILEISRRYLSCPIYIVTNGILLPEMPPLFWETCRQHNVILSITEYPLSIDYKTIQKTGELYGVSVQIFKDPAGKKQLYHLPIDLTGSQDYVENYLRCWRPKYPILKDGRIYPCVIPANIHHFNRYYGKELSVVESDSVDIYSVSDIEELLYKLSIPIKFCRYCNIYGETSGHPFEVSKKQIEEWL